jgi:hypothetical protein
MEDVMDTAIPAMPLRIVRRFPFVFLLGVIAMNAFANGIENFDRMQTGAAPEGWVCGVTGKGTPRWTIEAEPSAPSAPNVLKQSGSGSFPWCVVKAASFENGFVEVRFKPVSGREDQAGGVVWRWRGRGTSREAIDGERYYVARANALENNVSLYYTEGGSRKTIKYVDAPVAGGQWHTLRVEFTGARVKVVLDGVSRIELEDRHIEGPGSVGVWTKADSVTLFDDFAYGAKAP